MIRGAHAVMAALPMATLLSATEAYLNFKAAEEAERTLMRGFTSVRDMAGPTFSMKRVIDEGGFAGPRIWPSGAMISQTSGHGDYRQPYDLPAGNNSHTPRNDAIGAKSIADGPSIRDYVRDTAREYGTRLSLIFSRISLSP